MNIGVPKEIKPQENRISMVPGSVAELVKRGHRVFIQRGAGEGSSYSNEQYERSGATVVDSAEKLFAESELIVKVKEPLPNEISLLKPHHILFAYLHLAADKKLTESLMASGCTAIAYETLEVNRHLPLLEPMSEIAGRMSAIVGSYHLAKHRGGRGVLLGGVPGVAPGRVVILGGGTAGLNAARVATGIGADVTILEVDFDRMRFLDITMGSHTVYSNEANLADLLPRVDLVIGAVLVPGARAPKLITRELLRIMPEGSVFVDIAVDQGGCAETTRPTTHDDPTFVEEGVLHYCVANMPGAYSRTATQALNNVTHPWVMLISEKNGISPACAARGELRSGINVSGGRLASKPVAEAHGLAVSDPCDPNEFQAGNKPE